VKKIILSLFLLVSSVLVFSNEYDLVHGQVWESRTISGGRVVSLEEWRFTDPNLVEFRQFISEHNTKIGTYSISHEYSVPFITFYWEDGTLQQYLMLYNENFIVLYSDDSTPAFFLRNITENTDGVWGSSYDIMQSIIASSKLTDTNIQYSVTPEILGKSINQGWAVEGGVGERLFITPNIQNSGSIFISSGYIDYSRPYLFLEYARPKRIRITITHTEQYFRFDAQNFEVELNDTPNFQSISLWRTPHHVWGGSSMIVEIEIIEIYPGIKFDTMFINSILGDMTQ
jgi:hypothetical protein